MSEKILFVDDEPHLLEAIKRQMYSKYDIDTATSGKEALELIQKNDTYAVIVSDMRMPNMDGITFLKNCKNSSPDSMRLMLTGNIDQATAINAVNEGDVFRFLNKPAERHLLIKVLNASLAQYKLLKSEKELLHGTLKGTIKLLTDILSLTELPLLTPGGEIEKVAVKLAETMKVNKLWQVHYAALLSHIAYTTLPVDMQVKLKNGEPLSEQEKKLVERLPKVGYQLLNNIPRLTYVARIILYQEKNFDGTGFPDDGVSGHYLPIESRILKVVNDIKSTQLEKNCELKEAMQTLLGHHGKYDPKVLESLNLLISNGFDNEKNLNIQELNLDEINAGQKLVSDLLTVSGRLLLTADHELTESILQKLHNIHLLDKIKEPIIVSE
ncbi:MAG: response regulator [Gammaproteobacteria bacterium]|nr:response regulator [Gammaproteobacteria bacterium]